jgi:hypothetical protein
MRRARERPGATENEKVESTKIRGAVKVKKREMQKIGREHKNTTSR